MGDLNSKDLAKMYLRLTGVGGRLRNKKSRYGENIMKYIYMNF